MNGFVEKIQREIEKGQAERLTYERDIALDGCDPANADRIKAAKRFHRKVGAIFAFLGAAMIGSTYGFYVYTGDLYFILGLFGIVAFVVGLYQIVVRRAVGKSK